jgi:hypothetical protein
MEESHDERLAEKLHAAWQKYLWLFGEPPHGTLKQLKAVVALIPKDQKPEVPSNG